MYREIQNGVGVRYQSSFYFLPRMEEVLKLISKFPCNLPSLFFCLLSLHTTREKPCFPLHHSQHKTARPSGQAIVPGQISIRHYSIQSVFQNLRNNFVVLYTSIFRLIPRRRLFC